MAIQIPTVRKFKFNFKTKKEKTERGCKKQKISFENLRFCFRSKVVGGWIKGIKGSSKYQRSGVPTRDSSLRRILKVSDQSRVEAK